MILGVGVPLLVYRFAAGLGATTNLSQTAPWGLWIGFDMMTGIVLAAGGFTIGATVQIFGLKEYHPIERPAILTAFLGYVMAVIGLLADLGRPWNIVQVFPSTTGPPRRCSRSPGASSSTRPCSSSSSRSRSSSGWAGSSSRP